MKYLKMITFTRESNSVYWNCESRVPSYGV